MQDNHERHCKSSKAYPFLLQGTYQCGIEYTKGVSSSFVGFTYSDWEFDVYV
jgi:hypothetical protein